jgi:hypothetical protein
MAFLVFHSDRTIYRDANFHQEINVGKEFQIGQHFSKTVGEADASLIESRRWNIYAYFTKIAAAY